MADHNDNGDSDSDSNDVNNGEKLEKNHDNIPDQEQQQQPKQEEKESEEEKGPNIIVLSSAGKPIFSRYCSEEDLTSVCGFIQAIRATTSSCLFLDDNEGGRGEDGNGGGGDIVCLKSGNAKMVFLSIGALTLVAISNSFSTSGKEEYDYETEAYLKLQLEYIYGQIIFTLTDQVQSIFTKSPNFDLRSMLGATDAVMRGLLDSAGPCGNGGSFLTAGVEMVSPLEFGVRDEAGSIIVNSAHELCSPPPSLKDKKGKHKSHHHIEDKSSMKPLFAILLVGNKLITLVQPNYRPHQLHPSDLHLILNFVNFQPGLLTNELWFPICLPRFHSSAFLYAYTICFDPDDTKLSLVLISSYNTTEQFEFFRVLAMRIRRELGLPKKRRSILRIYDTKEIDEVLLDDSDEEEEKDTENTKGDVKEEEGDSMEAIAAKAVQELGLDDENDSDDDKDSTKKENGKNKQENSDNSAKSEDDDSNENNKDSENNKKKENDDVAWEREEDDKIDDDDDDDDDNNDDDEISDQEIEEILRSGDNNDTENTMQYKKADSINSSDNKSIISSSSSSTNDNNHTSSTATTSAASATASTTLSRKSSQSSSVNKESLQRSALAMALKEALAPKIQEQIIQKYKEMASALHFVFRCDVVVVNNSSSSKSGGGQGSEHDHHHHHMVGSSANNGVLTQCLSPPLGFPFVDAKSKRRVWNAYQRLSLRLRLGSASFESTMDAFDMIIDDDADNDEGGEGNHHNHNGSGSSSGLGGIGRDCPAQCLMESPPNVHGVTYALDGTELFIALNGKDFELYATLPGTVPPRNGSALCARLVRRLMNDERRLFLANPPTWRN